MKNIAICDGECYNDDEWQKEPEKAEAALYAARNAVRLLEPLHRLVYGILTIPGIYRAMIAFKER